MIQMTVQERHEMWKHHISEYRSSGLSASIWCEQQKVSLSALRYWITRFNKEQDENKDIQWVSMEEALSLGDPKDIPDITIQIGNATIGIRSNFSEDVLLRVLKILKAYA